MSESADPTFDDIIQREMSWVGEDDDESHLLVGWVLLAKFATTDGATTVAIASSESMDIVTQMGLVEYAKAATLRRLADADG